MSEAKLGPVDVKADDTCSECWRPAAYGFRRSSTDVRYTCEEHEELNELYSSLEWLTGERDYVIGDWLRQVESIEESTWQRSDEMKHFVILRDRVSDDMPVKFQHECTFNSLYAAVDEACKLTQEKIDRKEYCLRNITREEEEEALDYYANLRDDCNPYLQDRDL